MRRMPRHRRSLARRLARALAHALALLAIATIGGTTALGHVESEQRQRYPAPGEMVDIGGGRLIHLRTWGADMPGPTFILDISASLPSSAWAWIAQDLARTNRVVAYDRPGMAWSVVGNGPRDARTAAEALSAALDEAGIGGPFVVVGHSYGGFSARMFAHLRRADVVGLVLLDTTHEDGGGLDRFAALYRGRAWQGHLGLFQLLGHGNGLAGLPPAEAEAGDAVAHWTSHLDATADELEAWAISAADLRAAGALGDMPLLVVVAHGSEEHYDLQRDLARLSSASRYVELDVWHVSMLVQQDHAALVADEMRRFLAEVVAGR
jgi:pimeloyl-ACP methyl ester carboxylesterase